ncbi:unnamed protein product [Trichobilharzia regenti]|nr:unnamed protein product [Trichobilharzia regenti]
MPVIRVYGQKICCNVHGVLPYFYVDLPTNELDGGDFVRSFVFSLEKSIRTKLNNYNMKDMYIFDASVVSGLEHLLQPKCAPKYTSMELEVDISAWDILNRRELGINPSINPGLEAMWTEEEMRRISKFDKSENFPKMPTANELLPCDERKW